MMARFEEYSGIENLELMREAVNYNRYLFETVRRYAPTGGHILDFGAGNGEFVIPMAALGLDVTALEPDAGLRHSLGTKGIRSIAGLEELSDASLQYVYALNVLEHIEDDIGALAQLRTKLAPKGRLLIYVPAFPLLYTSMDAKVGHVRRYTRDTLAAAAAAAGFDIERVAYVDALGFIATLAFKLADNGRGTVRRSTLKLYDRLMFPLSRTLDCATHRWFGKNLLLIARKN